MSIAKMSLTTNMQRMGDLLSSVLGPKLVADGGEWGTYAWSQFLLGIPGMRIAGGTDEILRNIVGERVLGLPKEPPAVKAVSRRGPVVAAGPTAGELARAGRRRRPTTAGARALSP